MTRDMDLIIEFWKSKGKGTTFVVVDKLTNMNIFMELKVYTQQAKW